MRRSRSATLLSLVLADIGYVNSQCRFASFNSTISQAFSFPSIPFGIFVSTAPRLAPKKNVVLKVSKKSSNPQLLTERSNSARNEKTNQHVSITKRRGHNNNMNTHDTSQKPVSLREKMDALSLIPHISQRLHQVGDEYFAQSLNLQIYVALNVADCKSFSERFVPSVTVKKGLEPFSYHLLTSPLHVATLREADAFVDAATQRLLDWASSNGIPLRKQIENDAKSTISQAPFDTRAVMQTKFGGHDHACVPTIDPSNLSSGFTVDEGADGSVSTSRVLSLSFKVSDLNQKAVERGISRPGKARVVLSGSVPSPDGNAPCDSSVIVAGNVQHPPINCAPEFPESAVDALKSNHPCNLFYFKGEAFQNIQNKRKSVLYRQIRHLRNALSGRGERAENATEGGSPGFVSVKILPWSQYHANFNSCEMLRGHTMTAQPSVASFIAGVPGDEIGDSNRTMIDIASAAPHPLDPDAFFVSVELFTGDVKESGQMAHNAKFPPLSFPQPAALFKSSILPDSFAQREARCVQMARNRTEPTPIIDSGKMWISSNRRFFVRFADAERGPLGVLREMLGQLLEAFGVGTPETFSEEGDYCRKLDANLGSHIPRNFANITTYHYLGYQATLESSFISFASSFYTGVVVDMCGQASMVQSKALCSGAVGEECTSFSSTGEAFPSHWRSEEGLFNGGRTPETALADLGLDNLFSPLSGFPPITVGHGIGSSKKESAGPALNLFLKRNFYREIGQSISANSPLASSASSFTQRLLENRFSFSFGPLPSVLVAGGGCAATRYANVKLSPGLIELNSQFLADMWRPYFEAIDGKMVQLANGLNEAVVDQSHGASSMSHSSLLHVSNLALLEERAVNALRVAFSKIPAYKGFGFTIHSTVTQEESIESPVRSALWTSEVILKNSQGTLFGRGTGKKRVLSKHAAVLAALYKVAPEQAMSIERMQLQRDSNLLDPSDADGSAEGSAIFESEARDIDESYDPMTNDLLSDDNTTSIEATDCEHPMMNGWTSADSVNLEVSSESSAILDLYSTHVFSPATSMTSLYRRAILLQLESISTLRSDFADTMPIQRELEALLPLLKSGFQGDDISLKEVIVEEQLPMPELSENLRIRFDEEGSSPFLYRCELFAEGNESVLIAKSSLMSSPPLARLNALSTAYFYLVHDASILDETRSRLGGGLSPIYSVTTPTFASVSNMCLYLLGSKATVVRIGTASQSGEAVTCSNVLVPCNEKDSFVPRRQEQNWRISSAVHRDPDLAQRIAMLSAIRELKEASRPSGSVSFLPHRNEIRDETVKTRAPLPPVAFTVNLGAKAKGFLAKVLTLVHSEENNLMEAAKRKGVVLTLQESGEFCMMGSCVTIVARGLADPSRLRLLWDDRLWASSPRGLDATVLTERYIKVLDDTIAALYSESLPAQERSRENHLFAASEAASDVRTTMEPMPISMSLYTYDPDVSSQCSDGTSPQSLPLPFASTSGTCIGILSATNSLVDSLIERVTESYCMVLESSDQEEARTSFRKLLHHKVDALRKECLYTTDINAATLTAADRLVGMERLIEPDSFTPSTATLLSGASTCVPPSILGSRKSFNRGKHLLYRDHLDRFVQMLFGKTLDVFYTRPFVLKSSPSPRGYHSNDTHIAALEDPQDSTSNRVVHNWYCVLGLEVIGEEQRASLNMVAQLATLPKGSSSPLRGLRPRCSQGRLVLGDGDFHLPIGSLNNEETSLSSFGTSSVPPHMPTAMEGVCFTTDTNSIRKGFGGTIADIRPGFVVLGFGSGESKRDAHDAAARHALKWHFPDQMQELARRGVMK